MRGAPVRLRCEYLCDPIGLEAARPRLSWWPNDPRPAELQTAYRIQAASSREALLAGAADLWDTGQVASRATVNVEYAGRALGSRARVWWRVRCYDSDGAASPWSEPARFELAIGSDEWQGGWIASPLTGTPFTAAPAPVLFRDFELVRAPARARLYLALKGSALVEINGGRVADPDPAGPWQPGGREAAYRIFDVSGRLAAGPNRLAILLGDGAHCGHWAGGPRELGGLRPALRAMLVTEDADGTEQRLGSDASWYWYPSWIQSADRDGGEEIDGRRFDTDWSRPGHGPPGYPVMEEALPVTRFRASPLTPSATRRMHAPAAEPLRRRLMDGSEVVRCQFPRTVLGRLRLRFRARPGTPLTVRYGDWRPDGAEPAWSEAVDRYTARGDGIETLEPAFAAHLFRVVEIHAGAELAGLESVEAVELGQHGLAAAAFECDHQLVNDWFEAAGRTLAMGLALGPVAGLEVARRRPAPAEAPAILAGAAACLDVAALFAGWTEALAGATAADPFSAAPICDELLACLWQLYRCYGDRRLLEQVYPLLRRWLLEEPRGLLEEPRGLQEESGGRQEESGGLSATSTPPALREILLAEAWHCYALGLGMRMAGVLGRLADLKRFDALAGHARTAFRRRFVTADGLLAADEQLGYVLALELGLVEAGERATALARLEAQLRRDGFHPAVAPGHAALLLEVLTLEGRVDLAYQTLLQTSPPSWLNGQLAGATVLWDGARQEAGGLAGAAVAGWLQRFVLGLELDQDLTPELNAYRRMRIQPWPPLGEGFGEGQPIRRAAGHLDTVHGRYTCAWRIEAGEFMLEAQVPGNCSARVVLPDGSEQLVMAGSHRFRLPLADTWHRSGEIPVLREISGGQ